MSPLFRVRLSSLAMILSASSYSAVALAQAQPEAPPTAGPAASPEPAAPAGEQRQFEERLRAVFGHSGGLTSDEVARRVVATNSDILAKFHERGAAEAEVDRAKAGYLPRLTLTARYTRLSNIDQQSLGNIVVAPGQPAGPIPPGSQLVNVPLSFPVVLNHYLLQANVTVPISDYALRIGQSVAAASRSEEAARLNERAVKQASAAQAKIAYYNWVRAKLQQVVAEQTVAQAKTHQQAVAAAFDANRASRADVHRSESQRAQADLFAERAANATTTAETQLRNLMHDTKSTGAYAVGESLDVTKPGTAERASLDALYAEAAAHRLELAALDASARALEQQRRVSNAGKLPRLDAFGDAYYANPNQRYFPEAQEWHGSWDVGIQLTWTPNDLGTANAASRALGERAAALRAQRAALQDEIRSEILQARQGLADARATYRASQRSRAAAEEAYRVQRELFAYGKATNVELVDAETELLRARLDAVNALVDLKIAKVRLDHALGR